MTISQEKTRRAKQRASRPTAEAKRFARECRDLRQAMGLTQKQFAALFDLRSKLTVSRWERCAGHLPTADTMDRFRQYQHDWRLKNGDPKPKLSPIEVVHG